MRIQRIEYSQAAPRPLRFICPGRKSTYADVVKGQLLHDGVPIMLEDGAADNGWNLSIVEQDGERTFITIPGIESRWERRWFEHIDLGPMITSI